MWVANYPGIKRGPCAEGRGQSRIDAGSNGTLDHRRKWNSSVPLEKSGDAPTARDLIEHAVKRKLAAAAERQFIDDLADKRIRCVEVRQAVVQARRVRVLVDIDARPVTGARPRIE